MTRARLLVLVAWAAAVGVGATADDGASPRGAPLRGRVTQAGRGVSATVELRRLPAAALDFDESSREAWEPWLTDGQAEGSAIASVVTDAEGLFEVSGVPPGSYQVRAVASDGALGFRIAEVGPDGRDLQRDIVLAAGPHVLRVRVLHADGSPHRGPVLVTQPALGRHARPWLDGALLLSTDADGRFEARGLGPGKATVSAVLPGTWRAMGEEIVLPAEEDVVWTVDTGWVPWTGRVVASESAAPLPGARVFADRRDASGARALAAATADAGAFALPFAATGTRIHVFTAGRARTHFEIGALGPPTEPIPVVLLGRIVGRITSADDGHPVPGLRVGLSESQSPVTTDVDGLFSFDAVPAGWVRVFVEDPPWATAQEDEASPFESDRVEVTPGTTTVADRVVRRVELRTASAPSREDAPAPPSVLVRFRVRDATSGEPIAGAYVVELRDSAHGPAAVAVTGSDGLATLGPVVGSVGGSSVEPRVEVAVTAVGHEETHVKRGVVEGRGDAVIDVLLPRADPTTSVPRTIRGRVVPPSGVLLAPTEMRRTGRDEPVVGSWGTDGGKRVAVAPDGTFRVPGLAAGRYGLRAWMTSGGRDWFAHGIAETGGPEVVLHFAPAPVPRSETRGAGVPRWTLVVRDGAGRLVPKARVAWSVQHAAGATIDGSGRVVGGAWRHAHEASGPATLTAVVLGATDLADQPLALGVAQVGPLPPSAAPIEITLPPEQVIEGVVVDATGVGIAGAVVAGRSEVWRADVMTQHGPRALTGTEGRFRLGGLGDGEHVLTVSVPFRFARPSTVRAKPGREVRIAVHDAVAPRVRVVGPDDRPLPDAVVQILPPEDDDGTFDDNVVIEGFYSGPGWVRLGADGDGRVRFRRLDPERTYDVSVEPPEGRTDLGTVHLPAWRPKDGETFRLPPTAVSPPR